MRCPWCRKPNPIPDVVYINVESYGSKQVHFRCIHCNKVCKSHAERTVQFSPIEKSNRESGDWG